MLFVYKLVSVMLFVIKLDYVPASCYFSVEVRGASALSPLHYSVLRSCQHLSLLIHILYILLRSGGNYGKGNVRRQMNPKFRRKLCQTRSQIISHGQAVRRLSPDLKRFADWWGQGKNTIDYELGRGHTKKLSCDKMSLGPELKFAYLG